MTKIKIKSFHHINPVLSNSFSFQCTFSRTDVLGEMLYSKSTYKEYFTFALLAMSMLYLCCCFFVIVVVVVVVVVYLLVI